MKNNSLKLFLSLVVAILGLSSCNNEDIPSKINESFISLEASADLEQILYEDIDSNDDSNLSKLRSLDFFVHKSFAGKKHPSIALNLYEVDRIPIVAIIQNAKSGQRIIKNLIWRKIDQSGTRLSLHRKEGGEFTAPITEQYKDDWKLFLIMGGDYNAQDQTVSFKMSDSEINHQKVHWLNDKNRLNQMSSIYMPKDGWIDLSLAKGKNGVFEFKAKKQISLRNMGSFFAVRAINKQDKEYFLHKIHLSISNYRFQGKYDLTQTVVGQIPNIIEDSSHSSMEIRPVENYFMNVKNPTFPAYYVLWGMPIDEEQSTIGGQVTMGEYPREYRRPDGRPLEGIVEQSKLVQKDISLETNKVYGIDISVLAP